MIQGRAAILESGMAGAIMGLRNSANERFLSDEVRSELRHWANYLDDVIASADNRYPKKKIEVKCSVCGNDWEGFEHFDSCPSRTHAANNGESK